MARPRQPRLTRERIVEVAAALVDAEGLEAVSTRRLAAELGVQGPSLYHHFATKDEILDAVADGVAAQVDTTMLADAGSPATSSPAGGSAGAGDWRQALVRWARAYRAVLAAHPNIVPFLARGPGRRPAQLAMADAVYGVLVEAGWPPARATHIGALLRYLVAGSALGSFARGFAEDPAVYAEQYPHLSDAHRLAEHQQRVDEGAFELGLQALMEGLSAEYARLIPTGPLRKGDL